MVTSVNVGDDGIVHSDININTTPNNTLRINIDIDWDIDVYPSIRKFEIICDE